MRVRSLLVLLAACLLSAAGCTTQPPGGRRGDAGLGGDGSAGGGETGAQCGDGIDNDMDGLTDCDEISCIGMGPCAARDAGPLPDTGFAGCEAVEVTAMTALAPVDIVWVIDNSGSMSGEAMIIQMNMNNFAASIAASGIDYHVVVVTAAGFVNVPAPLGTDTERFLRREVDVQSHNALERALADYPNYASFLRPSALTHFIFVTDDEAEGTLADGFRSQMMMNLGHSFVAHVIASPPGSRHCPTAGFCPPFPEMNGCTGPNGDAADNGQQYWNLATATGGQRLNICTPDWSGLFTTLVASIAIPTPIPCEFDLPDPPDGMTFDRMRVNVVYTPSTGGGPITFPFVGTPDGASCPVDGEGWFYDDPMMPTRILLCPSTCSRVTADDAGSVNIALGCETLII